LGKCKTVVSALYPRLKYYVILTTSISIIEGDRARPYNVHKRRV